MPYDVRMPDGTIIKNVPDNVTKGELIMRASGIGIKAYPNARPQAPALRAAPGGGAMETLVRGAAQGATFNLADEAAAGADALTQPLLGMGSSAPTLGARYEENLMAQRDRNRANAEENPVSDIAGNIVGAVAGPGKFIKPAKSAPGIIGQSAGLGAIYGFGAGEGGSRERAIGAGGGALVGGLTGGVMAGGAKLFDAISPRNIGAKFVNKQFSQSPMTTESARISQQLGQTYTPGQATGSRSLLTIEGLVRRHPASADRMAKFDAEQMDRSLNNLITNLDRLHANPSGPEATGNLVSKSFDDVFNKAVKVRRDTASADFGKVDELANGERLRAAGKATAAHEAEVARITAANDAALATSKASVANQFAKGKAVMYPQVNLQKLPEAPKEPGRVGIVSPTKLRAEIDTIIEDFSAPGGGDPAAALVARANRLKASLPKDGGQLTASQTQRLLQIYGNASNGTGAIFKDLDTAQQRLIAKRLQNGLLADIDDAVAGGGKAGEIVTALKTARDNYKSNSKAINELEDSVLGRLFGTDFRQSPERIAQAMKNMKPSELQQSMGILNKADPSTSQAVKRFMVEDAMSTAGINPTSGAPQPEIAGEAMFSAPKFLTAIRKSPVWKTFSATERANMETAVRDLERISFRAGTDGSPTAPLLFAWEVAKAMGGGAMALSPTQIGKSVAAVMVPNKIAVAITTPQGQRALRTIHTSKPNSIAARAATSALVSIFVGNGESAPEQSQ